MGFNVTNTNPTPTVVAPRNAPAAAPQAEPPAGPAIGGDQLQLSTTAKQQGADQPQKTEAEKQADADAQKEGYTDAEEKKTYDKINEKLSLSRLISKIEEALKDDKK
jgi:hypothetical protein